MHRFLIIGCGSIGERHLRCLKHTARATVTACDTDLVLLDRLASTYEVETTSDWEQALLHNRHDAVVICTPTHLHVPMATIALRCGCHVLIEKPLSQSLRGVDELIGMRDCSGRQAAVAYVLRVYPILNQARDFLLRGEFGSIRHVTVTSGQYFPGLRPFHTSHYSKTYYRDRKTGGGAIQDALTHTANWIESVIGPTDSVLCDCGHQVLPDVTVEDTVNLSARHGEILVNYTLNQFQAPNESTLQFNTASGSVKIELHNHRWGTFRLGDSGWTWRKVPTAERDAPFITQANLFLDQMEGKPGKLCTVEAAAQTLRFNLAALVAADSGVRVPCASITS